MDGLGLIRGVHCVREYCRGNLYEEFNEVKCSLCSRWWDNLNDALTDTPPRVEKHRERPPGWMSHRPLNDKQIAEIKQRASNGEIQRALAEEFKVSHTTINRVVLGRSYYGEIFND